MAVNLDTGHLSRVIRWHCIPAPQVAAFFAACEAGGIFADGDELAAWRRSRGRAMEAWRALSKSQRRTAAQRWRESAEVLVADAMHLGL